MPAAGAGCEDRSIPDPGASVSPKRLFRALALAEAVTWTILVVAMILKYAAGVDWAVLVGGSIHGFVFLAYAFAAVLIGVNQRWSLGIIAFAVLTAIIPYATIPFEMRLVRRGRLDGDWRHERTEHPADDNWVNRMLRWFLARPVLLTVLAVAGIAAVFTVLLVIGPPGGREA
jgi:integral membrane protein